MASSWHCKSQQQQQQQQRRQNKSNQSTNTPNGDSWTEQEEAFFGPPSTTTTTTAPKPKKTTTTTTTHRNASIISSVTPPTIASIPNANTATSRSITSNIHRSTNVKRDENSSASGWLNQISNNISTKFKNLNTPTIVSLPPLPQQQQHQRPRQTPPQPTRPTYTPQHPPTIQPQPQKPQSSSSSSTTTTTNNNPYIPHCLICGSYTPSLPNTRYKYHPYFSNERMCATHSPHQIQRCCSCSRFGPSSSFCTSNTNNNNNTRARQFITVNDGNDNRVLCQPCARTSVKNEDEAEAKILWGTVLYVLKVILKLELWDGFRDIPPVLLVDHVYLNEQHSPSSEYFSTDNEQEENGNTFHTRGLCTYTYPPPRITSVLCLKHLPRSLTGSIMAHEATHAWFKLHPSNSHHFWRGGGGGGNFLPQEVEEGCCQLVAFLYLSQEEELKKSWDKSVPHSSSSSSDKRREFVDNVTDERLRQYFRNSIETDTTPVYGDGFREAARAYEKMGCCMKDLLEYVVKHQCFPP